MNPKNKLSLVTLFTIVAAGAAGCAGQIHSAYASPAASNHNSRARITAALSPHGSWVMTSDYGRAWQPYNMAHDWRPYTVGYWNERGDDMVWHSDFEWGWAAFHYGRWTQDSNYGWVWIAGDEWSPGWVVWRTDGDYVGWAPAPPAYVSYNVTVINTVPIGWWCFIPRVYVGQRHWYSHRVHNRYNDRHVRRGYAARSHRRYGNDRQDRGRHVDARRPRGTRNDTGRRGTAARRGQPAGSRNDGPVVGHSNGGRNDGRGARPGNDNRGRANDGRGARPGNDNRGNDGRGARPGNDGRDARPNNGFGSRPTTASSDNGRIDTGRSARPSNNGNNRGNHGGSTVANTRGPSANTGGARPGQGPTFGSRTPPKQRTPAPGTNARSGSTTKQTSGSRGERFTPHKEVRRIPDRKIERRPVSTRSSNVKSTPSRSTSSRSKVSSSKRSTTKKSTSVRSSRSSRSPSRSTRGRSSRSSSSRRR